jgi:hypothetical protein
MAFQKCVPVVWTRLLQFRYTTNELFDRRLKKPQPTQGGSDFQNSQLSTANPQPDPNLVTGLRAERHDPAGPGCYNEFRNVPVHCRPST